MLEDPQHAFDAYRATFRSLWMGIKGLDYFGQFFPGDKSLHLFQEFLFMGLLAKFLESVFGKGLLHDIVPLTMRHSIINNYGNKSELP